MSEGQLHRWRRIGRARKKRRWRRWATGRSKRSSDPRALGIGFSSVFFFLPSKWVLSASLVFTRFISHKCAQFVGGGGRECCHRARPSCRDGRQELDKIVCRHSLYRLNASMVEQKKERQSHYVHHSHATDIHHHPTTLPRCPSHTRNILHSPAIFTPFKCKR